MSDRSTSPSVLKTGAVAAAIVLPIARGAHAAGSDVLRVGLVGCGGRGTGAALNAMNADAHAHLTAMADLFPENIRASRQALRSSSRGR